MHCASSVYCLCLWYFHYHDKQQRRWRSRCKQRAKQMQPKMVLKFDRKTAERNLGHAKPCFSQLETNWVHFTNSKDVFYAQKPQRDTSPAPLFLRFSVMRKKSFWQFLSFLLLERKFDRELFQCHSSFMIQQLFYHFNGIRFPFGWTNTFVLLLVRSAVALGCQATKAIRNALSVASPIATPKIKSEHKTHTQMFH